MKEIDQIIFEIRRLLTEAGGSGKGTYDVHEQLQALWPRAKLLIGEIDNLEELVEIRKVTLECGHLVAGMFIKKEMEYRELKRQHKEAKKELKTRLSDLRQQGVPPRYLKSPEKLEEYLGFVDVRIQELRGGCYEAN